MTETYLIGEALILTPFQRAQKLLIIKVQEEGRERKPAKGGAIVKSTSPGNCWCSPPLMRPNFLECLHLPTAP